MISSTLKGERQPDLGRAASREESGFVLSGFVLDSIFGTVLKTQPLRPFSESRFSQVVDIWAGRE